jgi:putative transcriptional regulator
MLNKLAPTAGKLLISEPFMTDPNFTRAVVLLTEHSEEGTLGFIVNQPSLLRVDDVVVEIDEADFPVYYGGPVATDSVHFIHRCAELADGQEVAKGIYWGGNFEILKKMIARKEISTTDIKFFVGYSGWGAQQLKDELKENTWIVSDQFDADLLFTIDEEQLWREVIINLGPKYAHISNFPQNPNLN